MFKNRQEFEEALAKSIEGMKEELAKSKRYGSLHGDDPRPFQHGSSIRIHKAVRDEKTGKTHGYEVHETTKDGKTKVHENVPYNHLDTAMKKDKENNSHALLRMPGERDRSHKVGGIPLHTTATVAHGTYDSGRSKFRTMTLNATGDSHGVTEERKKDKEKELSAA